MSTATTAPERDVPASTVRLARALVRDAQRHGRREDPRVEQVAKTPLPDDDGAAGSEPRA